jgi:hypothetical protein
MKCESQEKIAEELNLSEMQISREVSNILEDLPKSYKVQSEYLDQDFEPPLYNVWTFAKKTNTIKPTCKRL